MCWKVKRWLYTGTSWSTLCMHNCKASWSLSLPKTKQNSLALTVRWLAHNRCKAYHHRSLLLSIELSGVLIDQGRWVDRPIRFQLLQFSGFICQGLQKRRTSLWWAVRGLMSLTSCVHSSSVLVANRECDSWLFSSWREMKKQVILKSQDKLY